MVHFKFGLGIRYGDIKPALSL